MNSWIKIFATRSIAEASILKGMLEENQVPVQQLNKQDSSYVLFGEIELYVPAHLKETADRLVQKSLLN